MPSSITAKAEKRLLQTILLISLLTAGVLYGVAASLFGLWPSGLIKEAQLAYEAYLGAANRGYLDRKPVGFVFFDAEGPGQPKVLQHLPPNQNAPLTQAPEDELILVGGGILTHRNDHCPDFGCLAWIMDRDGKVLHTWEADPEMIWEGIGRVDSAGFDKQNKLVQFQSHMFPNGDLLVSFIGRKTFPYGVGMARFDKDSNLLWVQPNLAHHWFSIDDQGRILTPAFREVALPYRIGDTHLTLTCYQTRMFEDTIKVLSPEGETLEEIGVMDSLVKSGFGGLLFESNETFGHKDNHRRDNFDESCDPVHLNDVRPLREADADQYPSLHPGDLLISLRNMNTVAVMDRQTHLIKWISTGQAVLQHSPRFLGNNRILMFDNQGGPASKGGSRLLEVRLDSLKSRTRYPQPDTPEALDFSSLNTGHLSLSGDHKRVLVALTRLGRLLEIDLTSGKATWEYINNHNVGAYLDSRGGGNRKTDIARVGVFSAHYISRPDFLSKAQP